MLIHNIWIEYSFNFDNNDYKLLNVTSCRIPHYSVRLMLRRTVNVLKY